MPQRYRRRTRRNSLTGRMLVRGASGAWHLLQRAGYGARGAAQLVPPALGPRYRSAASLKRHSLTLLCVEVVLIGWAATDSRAWSCASLWLIIAGAYLLYLLWQGYRAGAADLSDPGNQTPAAASQRTLTAPPLMPDQMPRDMRLISLHQMHPIAFERLIGENLFKKIGYRVEYTPVSGDGGVDIVARKGAEVIAIQCKRYKGTVNAAMVRELAGVLYDGRFSKGYLITTGTFSAATRAWAAGKPIELIDGLQLINWLGDLAVIEAYRNNQIEWWV